MPLAIPPIATNTTPPKVTCTVSKEPDPLQPSFENELSRARKDDSSSGNNKDSSTAATKPNPAPKKSPAKEKADPADKSDAAPDPQTEAADKGKPPATPVPTTTDKTLPESDRKTDHATKESDNSQTAPDPATADPATAEAAALNATAAQAQPTAPKTEPAKSQDKTPTAGTSVKVVSIDEKSGAQQGAGAATDGQSDATVVAGPAPVKAVAKAAPKAARAQKAVPGGERAGTSHNANEPAANTPGGLADLPAAAQATAVVGDTSAASPVAAAATTGSNAPKIDLAAPASSSAGLAVSAQDGPRTASDPSTVDANKATPLPPETRFAEVNNPKLVTAIHGQLLPNGGSMQLRLDPPELGAVHITVHMRDGVMTAAFETSNDHATTLLSHSLNNLKTALETQGVSVEKLQVRQTARQEQPSQNGSDDSARQGSGQDPGARREQQRRELLQKMWRRLNGANNPLDMVA